jgi:hypothetical protein
MLSRGDGGQTPVNMEDESRMRLVPNDKSRRINPAKFAPSKFPFFHAKESKLL